MLSQDAPAGSVRLPSGPFSRVYALEGPKRDVVVKLGAAVVVAARGGRAPGRAAAGHRAGGDRRRRGRARAGADARRDRPARAARRRPAPRPSARCVRRLHDSLVAADAAAGRTGPTARTSCRTTTPGRRRRARRWRHARAPRPGRTRARPRCRPAAGRRARPSAACTATCGAATSSGTATTRALVDWEYARRGDPAEELAYLIEMDGMAPRRSSTPCWTATATPRIGDARRGVAAARGPQRGALVRRARARRARAGAARARPRG